VVAALLAFIAYASSIRTLERRHIRVFLLLGVTVLVFGIVLYDVSSYIGNLEGPRLRQLELESSP